LLLDQGLTPQKPKDPIKFKKQQIFADSTSLVLKSGSKLVLGRNARIVIDNNSSLSLLEGSEIEIGPRARIIIHPSAKIQAEDGAIISGRGKIILKEGAMVEFMKESYIDVNIKRF
ncbi:MAG: hypothetical protein KAT31_00970, partial [Bacteroidales bacterium]|nr:hypothetical protein [Bacteroidales bacterium]